jgi:hypothetical protein
MTISSAFKVILTFLVTMSVPVAALPAESYSSNDISMLVERVQALETKIERLEDRAAIEKLTRAFNYYGDHGLWDNIVDLFADNSRIEISGRGAYKGKDAAERLFIKAIGRGKIGIPPGFMANHMTLQGIVDVAPDGKTAKGRWREFSTYGFRESERASWGAGTLAIEYVKEDGVWKFKDLQFYLNFVSDYDKGWGKSSGYGSTPSKDFPPDSPPTEYDRYPGRYVVPFHYSNPVSGKEWTLEETEKYSTHGLSPDPGEDVIQE